MFSKYDLPVTDLMRKRNCYQRNMNTGGINCTCLHTISLQILSKPVLEISKNVNLHFFFESLESELTGI